MTCNRMGDIDNMDIEAIIRLPFFHSLEKEVPDTKLLRTTTMWKITFRCNKITVMGTWSLLDMESENEFIVRYKTIEFKTT